MGTAVAEPRSALHTPTKSEVVEVSFLQREVTKDGKVVKQNKLVRKEEQKTKAIAEGFTLLNSQLIRTHRARTVEGESQIVPDAKENVKIFNKGIGSKETQKVNENIGETDEHGDPKWQFTPEVVDTIDWLREATQNRGLTGLEKTENAMKALLKAGAINQATYDDLLAIAIRNQSVETLPSDEPDDNDEEGDEDSVEANA